MDKNYCFSFPTISFNFLLKEQDFYQDNNFLKYQLAKPEPQSYKPSAYRTTDDFF